MSKEFKYIRAHGESDRSIRDYLDTPEEERETKLIEIDNNIRDVLTLEIPQYNPERAQEIMECCMNMIKDITESLTNSIVYSEGSNHVTEDGYEDKYNCFLKQLGAFLQYLSNSGSWHKKKAQSFDTELIRRMENMLLLFKASQKIC